MSKTKSQQFEEVNEMAVFAATAAHQALVERLLTTILARLETLTETLVLSQQIRTEHRQAQKFVSEKSSAGKQGSAQQGIENNTELRNVAMEMFEEKTRPSKSG